MKMMMKMKKINFKYTVSLMKKFKNKYKMKTLKM